VLRLALMKTAKRSTRRATPSRQYPISPLVVMAQLINPKNDTRKAVIEAEALVFQTVYRALASKHGSDEDALEAATKEVQKNGIGPEGDRLIDGVRVLLKLYGEDESFLMPVLDGLAVELWTSPDTAPDAKMALAASIFPYETIMKILNKWKSNFDTPTVRFVYAPQRWSAAEEDSFEWPQLVRSITMGTTLQPEDMNRDISRALGRHLPFMDLYLAAPRG
jgi:hypothetical protein